MRGVLAHPAPQAAPRGVHEASRTPPAASCPRRALVAGLARGLSGSRLACVAAARTAASPPSYPVCIAATSLCPSPRAAVNSRGAAWSSAWGPQVRSGVWERPPRSLRTAAPAPRVSAQRPARRHLQQPWQAARRRREVAGSCPPGLHVMVIVLIPASRADGGRRRWLHCGCCWGGLGEAEATTTPSSWQAKAGWSGTCRPHRPRNAHLRMTCTERPRPLGARGPRRAGVHHSRGVGQEGVAQELQGHLGGAAP